MPQNFDMSLKRIRTRDPVILAKIVGSVFEKWTEVHVERIAE